MLHKDIPVGADSSHPPGYVQAGDPGAVGAYKVWIDTSSGTGLWVKKIRNAANSGWETVGAGSTTLDSLSDVVITAGASGDILRHNGTNWVDAAGIVATDITSGTVPTARLGSGTADATTFLRGDQTYAVPAGGGGTERALVDPTGLSRSWVNQGSATETVNGAAISLHAPANAADSFRIREWAVASKPYSKIFHILPSLISSVTFPSVGVGWRESGSGKLATVVRQGDGALSWYLSKYTNETTWSAHYLTLASTAPMNWIRLSDAAAGNRTVEISADGWNWILIHSVATDDFLTPDKFILTVNPRHATYACGVTLDSYE